MQEIHSKAIIVSATGGTLDYISPYGEVLFSIHVPPGKFRAGEYLELAPEGCTVEVAEGLVVLQTKGWAFVQPVESHSQSGANPDYQPTSADRNARIMAQTMRNMMANQARLEARMAALGKVEMMPKAPTQPETPEQEEGEVVE